MQLRCKNSKKKNSSNNNNNQEKLALLNIECPLGKINAKEWSKFRTKLSRQLSAFPFEVREVTSEDGVRVITCASAKNFQPLVDAVDAVIERLSIERVPADELQHYFVQTAWVWIRYGTAKRDILQCIARDNPDVDTTDWSIVKAGQQDGSGQHYLLQLREKDVAQLKRCGGRLKFGDTTLYLRFNKPLGLWVDLLTLDMGHMSM